MKPLYKGLIVAAVHVAIVCSLGAKLLYDRSTRPRVWARTAPYDPDLPIRGRYVSLQLEVIAPGIKPPEAPPGMPREEQGWQGWWWRSVRIPVVLKKEDDQLVAERDTQAGERDAYREGQNAVLFRPMRSGETVPVLVNSVLYFIPEHAFDPSQRAPGEELWVEVTLPKKGPPRPLRLAVKRADGSFTPLNLD